MQCDPVNSTMNSTFLLLVLTHIYAEAVGMVRLRHAKCCAVEGIFKGQNRECTQHSAYVLRSNENAGMWRSCLVSPAAFTVEL